MPAKAQRIFDLLQETSSSLSDRDNWIRFLKTAAWQYKYPFADQILIYAQRPDATACARIEVWNNSLHRRVDRGAKGIALLRENGNRYGLEYVFDVSDTHDQFYRGLRLWKYNERYADAVIETLESSFGELQSSNTIHEAILSAAHNAVQDNKGDYIHELKYAKRGSFLSGLDDVNLDLRFRQTAEASVAYMIMERMGLNPETVIDSEDFEHIRDFNTKETIDVLGGAVSAISETALRNISETIRAEQRKFAQSRSTVYNVNKSNISERGDEHGGGSIQDSGRLSASRPDSADGGIQLGQVRNDATDVSEEQQTDTVLVNADERDAARTLAGRGQDSVGAGTEGSRADGKSRGSDGGNESEQSVEMDRVNEQFAPFGGGVGSERTGIQLTLFDMPLPTAEEQEENLRKTEQTRPVFLLPQQIIDEVLTSGANNRDSIINICVEYSKDKSSDENISFLKDEYKMGGKGFIFDGTKVSAWWNDEGIRIVYGDTAVGRGQLLTWEQADSRIKELLELGRFAPQETLDNMGEFERKKAASAFWYMHRDVNFDDYSGYRELFDEAWFNGGYPDSTARITELLYKPEELDKFIEVTSTLAEAYQNNRDTMRFSMYSPDSVLRLLKDLQLERLHFTADEYQVSSVARFITEDEINKMFTRGSGMESGKIRIYLYFQEHTDLSERIKFLRDEYGTGGYSGGLFNEWHDTKGIDFSRSDILSPLAKVTLTWNNVAKRIDSLIKAGKYLTEREIAEEIPKYNAEQERLRIRSEQIKFLNDSRELSPQERQMTMPKRLVCYVNTIEISEKRHFERNGLADVLNAGEAEFAEIIKDNAKREQIIGCLEEIQRATGDVHARSHAYLIENDLKELRTINLTRVGDFYEVYGDEAVKAAEILQLTLTRRHTDEGDIAMTGIPTFALERFTTELQNNSVFVNIVDVDNVRHNELLEQAKSLINEFCEKEYSGEADFSDLEKVSLAYTVDEDGSEIQVDADLVNFRIIQYVDNHEINTTQYDSLEDMITNGLTDMQYDELIFMYASDVAAVLPEKDERLDEVKLRSIVIDLTPPQENERAETQEISNDDLIGKEVELDGRRFVIERVGDISGDVSMRDVTFENDAGFPISRIEKIGKIRSLIAEQEQNIIPAFEKQQSETVRNMPILPDIPMSERRNFVITDDNLGHGGAKEKFHNNMEAIRTLKLCEAENRLATPEEQEILSRYVGWGGLPEAFDERKDNWSKEYAELQAALTPEEYSQARASTLNAHYTSPTVIKTMYKALENMGFQQGNILEPSCGIGNFMGLLPESMGDSRMYGIEIDSITGRIAQQLYQRNIIAVQGYENTTLPDSFFDVAVGNVPFGNYKLPDRKYNKHNFLIHDYFFAKTLDKVRPGGVVAFITSKGTMDKQNPSVRKYIAQRADLLGAIRLPNNAFKANAGTDVTTDIIFLQKRDRMTDIMPEWINVGKDENGIPMNQYFIDNPDMILGEMVFDDMMYGDKTDTVCRPFEDADLAEQLNDAIQNIHAEITEYEFEDISNDEDLSIPANPNVRNFSYTIVDGDIYFRENSRMNRVETSLTGENRIKGMIELRDCVRTLIEYQSEGYSDAAIKEQQAKLNKLYDDYTAKYGLINSRGNSMAFSSDSSYFLLCSLEILNDNGELERKADMFTKRTIGARQEITHVDTASEALAVSLGEKARVDMAFMSELTGKTEQELFNDLQGVIFLNPHYNDGDSKQKKYLTADEYLSGNVRAKLAVAEAKAQFDTAYRVNVDYLTKVQPKDLSASEIEVRLGTTWIPESYIKQFIVEFLNPSDYAKHRLEVHYMKMTGEWNVAGKSNDYGNVKVNSTYGTKRINAYKIIEDTLNLKDVRIFDYVEDERGKRVAVLNKKETTIAQQKQESIKNAFKDWIWKEPTRREELTRMYNDKFNSTRPREYDGSHLVLPGMNPEIQLRQHQKNAIARILYGGNSLLGHVVGAGKTWTMAAAAMESKRLGLCNKSIFVVPNHLTEQWAAEFLQLYPAANVLVATKKDFETKNRKKFCARIATGDYDAIIIGHSQFEKIPMSAERQTRILENQIEEIVEGIRTAKADKAENYTIKQMEKTRKNLEAKLDKLNNSKQRDDVVTFEELGVDRLFVDEAHYYKNLFLYTKMRNVGGIAQTEAQKSSDMFMKCRYLDELTGGKGTVFATGTPEYTL